MSLKRNELHEYIAKQLAEKLRARRIVVWYDPRSEFADFVLELRGGPAAPGAAAAVELAGVTARLLEYAGSMFELRFAAETWVAADQPEYLVVYLPGCSRDLLGSPLMELELGGIRYEPQFKSFARNLLRPRYTDGVIDEILAPTALTYRDVSRIVAAGSAAEPPSILKGIFHSATGAEEILAAFLAGDNRDAEIEAKEATRELRKLVLSRLGLDLPEDAAVARLRTSLLRYVLAGEFRSDLGCPPPESLSGVPRPRTKDDEKAVRDLAKRLRADFGDAYEALADQVEQDLRLAQAAAGLPASALGSIDTFRFEERLLLDHCGELIAAKRFAEAREIVRDRELSFWLDRDFDRKSQWQACLRMAELGQAAAEVLAELRVFTARKPDEWVAAYARLPVQSAESAPGWYRLDQAQRRLETWVASLMEDCAERPLAVVRRAYEDACQAMADGFTKALVKTGFASFGGLHQTRIFSEVVAARPKPVAYFLVDALRFEMGVELGERLPRSTELSLRHAIGVLPSITPLGMAALQPGAAGSFGMVEQGGRLGATIDGVFLPDLPARKKFAAARLPQLLDLSLDEVLVLPPSKLARKLEGIQILLVRSREIDHAGEAGMTFHARPVMDTVIDNLARAIRKLAAAGIEQAIVAADHGHLFFPEDRDPSMRTDAPGGDTVELHRRCWIGRGGATPPGCVRLSAAALGYDSDLELVFPAGAAVFKAGGDLAFHHGGPTLQELVLPVLTLRSRGREAPPPKSPPTITVGGMPEVVTNRILAPEIAWGSRQLLLGGTSLKVRPILVSPEERQIGAARMALGAEIEEATGCVTLAANQTAKVGLLLSDESATELRLVILDPATDVELYRSPSAIPIRLGV